MLDQITVLPGTPSPLGLSFNQEMINFAVFSSHATSVVLGIFSGNNPKPEREIPLQKSGDIWHVAIKWLPIGMTYAFRCEGPYDEKKGLLFKSGIWLADPYAKSFESQTRTRIVDRKAFDWQGDKPPNIPLKELVIYEMHVRGFTVHSSSAVAHPGTFLGIIEKIPYLKQLGVNAIELMPIFEFDETYCHSINPKTGKPLINYWGYNPLHFFVPKRGYALSDPLEEFKTLVRELHKNGIEILLDVVYNHTGEEQDINYYVNFRGVDNSVYYQLNEQGKYQNFSNCGNTLQCNHPATQQLILDSLRYWIEEMHVDGFRFDLASIFTRDSKGDPLPDPPILKAIASDPVIKKAKLIAEPWDAGGLSQLGEFSKRGLWSEWNSQYRDVVRCFIKGTDHQAPLFGKVLSGSEDIYGQSQTPLSSVNYVTCHDDFCLRDLVTYQQKRNEENGEMNRDGINQSYSWNCGAEGPVSDKNISDLRERQMRNFLLALFLSQGIPMLFMGDEYGHTRQGNNNPYPQDNPVNWFLWDELEKNKKIFNYVSALVEFRKKHPHLQKDHFLRDQDIQWHGTSPLKPDWGSNSKFVAFSIQGQQALYAAFNANSHPMKVTLPQGEWHLLVNTTQDWDQHQLLDPTKGLLISSFELSPYSAILAST